MIGPHTALLGVKMQDWGGGAVMRTGKGIQEEGKDKPTTQHH